MRRPIVLVHLCCSLALAAGARAQTPSVAAASPTSATAASPTSATAAPTPPETATAADAAAAPQGGVTTSGGYDPARSLFDQTWHQLQFGGRFSNIDGDPARFQRYQDLRDGVTFTDARFERGNPDGSWLFRATADNVGYRDQRYSGSYEKAGRFAVTGLWDEIPQFYSVDTKTPYTSGPSPLLLDDATQRAIQNGQATLSAYVPLAPQFDLRERRDIGAFGVTATPTKQIDLNASLTTTRHRGELPWGGSFGFSNDVEVALPYDSRTNDFNLGAEWMKDRNLLRLSYSGSWFNNLDQTLLWDSPLRLDDSTSAPGRGQMALWPTNSAQTISAAGYRKFEHRTQLTGSISYGFWNNDEPLLPFTINSALTQLPLPRATADISAHVFSTNLNLVSRPKPDWDFSTRFREYSFNNQSPVTAIPQYVSYDTSVNTSSTGGPDLYAHSRTTFDGDATWTGLPLVALTAGYTFNGAGYDARIFDSTAEHVLRLAADAVGGQSLNFHAKYEYGSRNGSGLDEASLVQIGEQPDMRHYDVADRNRSQFTGIVDYVPNDLWTFSVSGGVGRDDYPDSYFGLQKTNFNTVSFAADYVAASGLGAGASYNYERYSGLQRSRSASSGQETDPLRDWTVDTGETVNYFSIYVTPPKIGEKTEARISYDFSNAEGSYVYGVVTGGPLAPPSQLPNVTNKLQQLHVNVRHRLSNRFAADVAYLYEPFSVYDFAFDPSVVNGIVQPSSLVLGYVYRPYTANSLSIGLRYLW